jgi:hypothetical protein
MIAAWLSAMKLLAIPLRADGQPPDHGEHRLA